MAKALQPARAVNLSLRGLRSSSQSFLGSKLPVFLHVSNLYHLMAFALYLLLLSYFAKNTAARVVRTISSVIQLSVILLCLDILIGFLLIEKLYGSNLSAGWISKSIFGFPLLVLASFVWMWTSRRRAQRLSGARTDTKV